jgi:hypothetical protein
MSSVPKVINHLIPDVMTRAVPNCSVIIWKQGEGSRPEDDGLLEASRTLWTSSFGSHCAVLAVDSASSVSRVYCLSSVLTAEPTLYRQVYLKFSSPA